MKIFKRDYVWLGDFSSAARVIEQLEAWFGDYNENAPHKALRMKKLTERSDLSVFIGATPDLIFLYSAKSNLKYTSDKGRTTELSI